MTAPPELAHAAPESGDRSRSLISAAHRPLILALALFAITLVLYRPVFHFPFIGYDDPQYVTENAHIQHGITRASIRWAFTSFEVENWHPLTWLSHMADYDLFGDHAGGHHLTNVFLHGFNAVLLFALLWRATGRLYCSLLVAAIFAVHPLNVQSVAWISERKNLLSTFFGFLCFATYGSYVSSGSRRSYILALLLFACSLMAKPYLVTLPFLLIVIDFWPLNRWHRGLSSTAADPSQRKSALLLEKIPFFALAAASCVITMFAQANGGALRSMRAVSLGVRLANAAWSYLVYLRQTFWPVKLAIFYPLRGIRVTVAILSVAILAITLAAWRLRKHSYFLAGWLWFLGLLVPMIGIIQVGDQAHADRYMYLPLVGLLVTVVWGAADGLSNHLRFRGIAFAAGLVAVVLLSWRARAEIWYWRDTITLFSRAVAVTPPNSDVQDELGEALVEAGRTREAMPHFYSAISINPGDGIAHYNLGRLMQENGDLASAIEQFRTAILLTLPGQDLQLAVSSNNNLGVLYLQMGKLDLAQKYLDKAIALNPKTYKAYTARGMVRYQQHRLPDAVADLKESIDISPSAFAYYWLGEALLAENRRPEALAAYNGALKMYPGLVEAQQKVLQLQTGEDKKEPQE